MHLKTSGDTYRSNSRDNNRMMSCSRDWVPNEGLARGATCLLSPRSLFPWNLILEGGQHHDSGLQETAIASTWDSLEHWPFSMRWYLEDLKVQVNTMSKGLESH